MKKTTLSNGLRVVSHKLDSTKAVTVLVLIGAGSRNENRENRGISHFLEHMFFKGALKYKNAREVSEAVDSVGGEFNAFTGKEYAGYYVKVASGKVDVAFDVLSDMMLHARFDQGEIEKERGVILEEYNMYQDTPMYQIGWNFENLLFGDQPLGWDEIGTKEFIRGVSHDDFVKYKDSLYTSDNTVIAIAGNIGHDEALEKVDKFFRMEKGKRAFAPEKYKPLGLKQADLEAEAGEFGAVAGVSGSGESVDGAGESGDGAGESGDGAAIKAGGVSGASGDGAAVKAGGVSGASGDGPLQVYLKEKKTEQAHLSLGVEAYPETHPDHWVLKVLAVILGGNMSSRMFLNIREAHGLAYYIRTNTDDYMDTGAISTTAGVDVTRAEMAVEKIIEQYKLVLSGGGAGGSGRGVVASGGGGSGRGVVASGAGGSGRGVVASGGGGSGRGVVASGAGGSGGGSKVGVSASGVGVGAAGSGAITAAELDKAKNYLKGKMILSLEDSEEYAHLLAKFELLHKEIMTPEEIMREVSAVTLGDVERVAVDLFGDSSRLRLAVIGPYSDPRVFERLMR